jgi:hypothetical protein
MNDSLVVRFLTNEAISIEVIDGHNPNGNNPTITSTVCPGDVIPFSLTYSVDQNVGNTTFPRTVGFDLDTVRKPAGATDVASTGFTTSHTFTAATGTGSTFTDSGSMTAPTTLGVYTVQVGSVSGTGGQHGISGGQINVHFTVADCNPPPDCTLLNTVLTVSELCVTLHQSATVDLTATLKDENAVPLFGSNRSFLGSRCKFHWWCCDWRQRRCADKRVQRGVGDYTVSATFDGVPCPKSPNGYNGTNDTGNIGVTYLFIGFEQPINADGSSIFNGGTVPVKIRISDANGAPVTDANAYVWFAKKTDAVVGDTQEAVSQSAASTDNQMRYDRLENHYVFQWDITGAAVTNGTYALDWSWRRQVRREAPSLPVHSQNW